AQNHKHLPEMLAMTGLTNPPVFMPIVGDFYSGMVMTLPLHRQQLKKQGDLQEIKNLYTAYYEGEPLIKVNEALPEDGFIHGNIFANKSSGELFVGGNEERLLLIARYDNLGKGASGAAIQNMNIMLGIEEQKGIE
ncbi:MAG: N-acetyl-gamma-glutamyl-phosphate reductase, partial [Anaerovoracaceae bacterium]